LRAGAVRLVAQAGRGAVMMKRDLKAAFRHVPINPCDYWLLIFEWDGKFYVDMFLPFGLRTAPRIFNLFAEALHCVLETLFEWNCTHYLDDFLFVFPPGTDLTSFSAEFDDVLAKFWFVESDGKRFERLCRHSSRLRVRFYKHAGSPSSTQKATGSRCGRFSAVVI
jgi:hypothetical protein